MNDGFTSPDGFVSVSYPDSTPRPRLPISRAFFVGRLSAEFTDFFMGWLPTYTDRPPSHVPARPARIGVTNIFTAGIAPLGWEPHYPTYRAAPRVHRVFYESIFDPRSGNAMVVAQRMAWDPRQHPIVTRPKLKTSAFFYVPTLNVSGGGLTCTAITDLDLTSPTFLTEALTTPTLRADLVTTPTLIDEGVC